MYTYDIVDEGDLSYGGRTDYRRISERAGEGASEGPEPVEKTSEEMRPHMKNGKRQQIKKMI